MKIWPRAQGKMGQKYQKNAKWPNISFRGPIWVPKVPNWGFWGLVFIEKWSQNFDSDSRVAISSTPNMAKMIQGPALHVLGVTTTTVFIKAGLTGPPVLCQSKRVFSVIYIRFVSSSPIVFNLSPLSHSNWQSYSIVQYTAFTPIIELPILATIFRKRVCF